MSGCGLLLVVATKNLDGYLKPSRHSKGHSSAVSISKHSNTLTTGEEATDPSYLAKLGDLHEQVGDQSSAASYFNACVNLADEHNFEGDPAIVRARLWLARYLHAAGRTAEAESVHPPH